MFVPGVVTFAGLSACCLGVSVYLFRKPKSRLPEWRWLSLILAVAFGAFAVSFARPSSDARPVAEGLLVLVSAAELVISLRRDRDRTKSEA